MKKEVANYLMRSYPIIISKMKEIENSLSNDVEAYVIVSMLKNKYEERIRKSGGVNERDSDKFIHELNVLADAFHVATDYATSDTKKGLDRFFEFLLKAIPIEEKFDRGEITWEERTEMIAKLWNSIFRKRKIKKKAT